MLQSELDLILPYISSDLPGVGGVLRPAPDDFVVEEVPLYEAQGDGQHLYVNITKVGLTTKEVQLGLERLFGLKKGDVSFAGMKDKRARTTQYMIWCDKCSVWQHIDCVGIQRQHILEVKVS